MELIKNKKAIIILNKIDLKSILQEDDPRFKEVSQHILKISALHAIGIEKLYQEITDLFQLNEINLDNEIIVTNIRHKNLITKSIYHIQKTKEDVTKKMPLDIIAISIKDILEDLGNITGEMVSEDIINEIFAKFCLGK